MTKKGLKPRMRRRHDLTRMLLDCKREPGQSVERQTGGQRKPSYKASDKLIGKYYSLTLFIKT